MYLEFEGFSHSQEIEAEKRAVSGGTKKATSPRKESKVRLPIQADIDTVS